MAYFGQAGAIDKAKGRDYYRQACELGESGGCERYGWALRDGEGGAADAVAATAALAKACSLGRTSACTP
jgi:TPR repeat protein